MERLTTDKFTKDMRMYELAHNSCYVGENGVARYRDFDKDVEARDYIRKLMLKYGTWEEDDAEMTDDDSFDESMIDLLFYGEESIEGIIALLYLHMWSKADLHGRLKEHEDTNLTPEQMIQIDKDFREQAKELGKYKKLVIKLQKAYDNMARYLEQDLECCPASYDGSFHKEKCHICLQECSDKKDKYYSEEVSVECWKKSFIESEVKDAGSI